MTNYNELGQEYISYASAPQLVAYGTLSFQCAAVLSALRQEVVDYKNSESIPVLVSDLLRLLSRLDTVFYYSSRVADYLKEIELLPRGTGVLGADVPDKDFCPPLQITRNHKELGMEFESLILHAVAALDNLANLFAAHCGGCEILNVKGKRVQVYFKDARRLLENSMRFDKRAKYLLEVLNECESTLNDIVLSIGRKTLRNHLAHETPIADLTESHFMIYWLADGRVLRFDHEVYGMPLVASARTLIQTVTYLVMKSVAILLVTPDLTLAKEKIDVALKLKRDLCEPSWSNPVVSWRSYISTNKSHPEFTVVKTNADGFVMKNVYLNPDVFEFAMPFNGRW